ncbi:sensor domain-containing diguanylate cyclase [Ketobacter sp.]|nr:MAG: diguanylate cyclase [Ketobacter sp.]
MRFRVLVLLLLLSSTTANLHAQALVLDPLIQGAPLGKYMSFWVDEVGDADLQKVIRQADWLPSAETVPNHGLSRKAFWFRLQVQNNNRLENWLLELSNPLLDELDFYLVSDDGLLLSEHHMGIARPNSGRQLVHRLNLVPFDMPGDGHFTIYLRVISHHSMQLPASLWSMERFIEHSEAGSVVVGMLAGALAIMLLYNFFLYTAIRDPIYLVYVCGVCSFLVLQISLKGLGYRFLWGEFSAWSQVSTFLSAYCALFFATTFAMWFLKLKQRGFRLLWAINLVRYSAIGALLMLPVLDRYWNLYIVALLAISVICVGFIAIFTYYKSGDRPIKIFIAAWVVFLLGVLLYIFNKLGWISVNVWTEQTIALGMITEMILFSIALGDRINTEKAQALAAREKVLLSLESEQEEMQRLLQIEAMELNAKELSLQVQLKNNAQLEQSIEQRTGDLRQAAEKLRELVRLDPLTQVYNRHFFNEQIAEHFETAKHHNRFISLLMIDVDHFKAVNDQWGHAIGDKCLCAVAARISRLLGDTGHKLFRFGGEEFVVLMPGADPKQGYLLGDAICEQVSTVSLADLSGPDRVTVSIGVAGFTPAPSQRSEQLVGMADTALYRAKQSGRNRVQLALENGGQLRA